MALPFGLLDEVAALLMSGAILSQIGVNVLKRRAQRETDCNLLAVFNSIDGGLAGLQYGVNRAHATRDLHFGEPAGDKILNNGREHELYDTAYFSGKSIPVRILYVASRQNLENTLMNKKAIKDVLQELMNEAGIENPNQLARETGMHQPTIFRILSGEIQDPKSKTIEPLAHYFGVTVAQLRGELPLRGMKMPRGAYAVSAFQVPEISWVRAGDLCDNDNQITLADAADWHPCPVPYKRELYALRVVGDSMDNGEDGYKDGEIIYVDPTLESQHNSDVIVRTPDGRTTFKRLQISPDGQYLLALNPHHPNRKMTVPEGTRVCGVIVFSGKKRR
jgi:SOS-response transcriptional repressor LexA